MRWSISYRMRLVLVESVAAIVLSGGSVNAEIIMSEPTNVGPIINNASDVQECDFSHDGLELYFSANRPGGYGGMDIWVARRKTANDPWQEPVNLGPNVNSSGREIEPSISGDSLELYFGYWDDYNIYVCTRTSKDATWSSPVKVGSPVPSNDAWRPDISADGLSLYFAAIGIGGHGGDDIWVTTRATKDDPWSEPVNLGPNVNSSGEDFCPSISSDDLTLVFMRDYTSMWAATRKSIDDDWGPAVDLGFNRTNFNGPALSPDGSTLYFDANTQYWGGYGSGDILQVKFIPIVDFNSDEIVDTVDMCIMVDNWHTDSTLCDIAPLPLGDGYVDVKDLVALAEHLFEDVNDTTLIAHWPLDETQDVIAYNSASDCDGSLMGGPIWQPEGGQVGGALQLDGVDDYVITPFIVNPADGPFSVFAWIKGGASGQVIISQTNGAGSGETWLGTEPVSSKFMTGLVPLQIGRYTPQPLVSESIITNDQWHHIGFVWDGSYRSLYVDGVEVAKDATAQAALKPATGGLYIGTGKNLEAETFFSGLIDDVRIYDRVLTPEQISALAQ